MNNRSLICCKPSRPTPSRAELTSHPAIPVGISDVSMRLIPTHRMSGEYSRGKVPKVVVFISDDLQCDSTQDWLLLLGHVYRAHTAFADRL